MLQSARQLDIPTLDDHIPDFLAELVAALQSSSDQTIPDTICEGSPPAHGRQRVQDAFNVEEIVAEYNILRGCVHDLADDNNFILQGKPFRIINRVFDHAIGLALRSYATQQAVEVQHRREEYLAFVAHDLRTPLNAISLAGRVLELTIQKAGITDGTSQMFNALRRNVNHLEAMVSKACGRNKLTESN